MIPVFFICPGEHTLFTYNGSDFHGKPANKIRFKQVTLKTDVRWNDSLNRLKGGTAPLWTYLSTG